MAILSSFEMTTTVQDIVYRIQCYVFPRRVRAKEFFRDYDPLRSMMVTREQFARAVDICGVRPALLVVSTTAVP